MKFKEMIKLVNIFDEEIWDTDIPSLSKIKMVKKPLNDEEKKTLCEL
jgi:hypothetical protein